MPPSPLLNSMGLVSTVQAIDSQLPGGTVVDQDPKAGIEVQPGATMKVYISNAPAADDRQGAGRGRASG